MSTVFIHPVRSIAPAPRGRMSNASPAQAVGVFRLPTNPLFYASLQLQNIVVGSRYRITVAATGEELATGVAAATTVDLSGLPAYANPMLTKITVRKGTTAPKYEPFETFVSLVKSGAVSYISQIPDPIA